MISKKDLKKLKKEKTVHDRALATTSLALGIALISMMGLNIFAYLTIIDMSEKNTYLQNAAANIKLKVTNANLGFREIVSGFSERDMGDIWSLITEASKSLEDMSDENMKSLIYGKIKNYKDALVKSHFAKDEKRSAATASLDGDYKKSFSDLVKCIDDIDTGFKQEANDKILTFKLLYTAILVNFLILFWFATYSLKRYINNRKRVEQELESTKEDLNLLFNSMDAILLAIDTNGFVIKWNTAAEKYFGIPESDALDKRIWVLVPFMMEYKNKIEAVLISGKPKVFYREKIFVGERNLYFNIIINPMTKGDRGTVIRIEDVTERELKDEQIRQSQKMEVVENLIGGLAHDFNNVLGAITGTISMMKFSMTAGGNVVSEDVKNNMDLIESSAERAFVMVQQLLSLSMKHEMSFAPVDVNMSVMHVLKICQNTFDKRIELIAEIYDAKSIIKADPAQIEQALLNLCDNALQAMTVMRADETIWGGALTISVDRVCVDKTFRSEHPQAVEDSYWTVSVSDTGIGMDRHLISRIFDPFFTTKKEHGTGLGLAMVSDIVKKHNGFIEVRSELGKGSVFILYLPEFEVTPAAMSDLPSQPVLPAVKTEAAVPAGQETAAQTPAPATVQPPPPIVPPPVKTALKPKEEVPLETVDEEQIPTGSGLVLVADDEAIMRKTAGSILQKLGYDVIYAEDGQETVDVFRNNSAAIVAVILDFSMPKMSGRDAYIEMKKIKADLKVLLVSGYKRDEKIEEVLALGVNGFVQKPYSMITLAREVKNIIS